MSTSMLESCKLLCGQLLDEIHRAFQSWYLFLKYSKTTPLLSYCWLVVITPQNCYLDRWADIFLLLIWTADRLSNYFSCSADASPCSERTDCFCNWSDIRTAALNLPRESSQGWSTIVCLPYPLSFYFVFNNFKKGANVHFLGSWLTRVPGFLFDIVMKKRFWFSNGAIVQYGLKVFHLYVVDFSFRGSLCLSSRLLDH